jgi:hypothetical protein
LTVRNGEACATFGGRQFHYRLEGNRTSLLALNGRKVELAYDPLDLGEAAVYYENGFVGLAHSLELRRMGEDAFVQDERDRRATRRDVKRLIATVHQVVPIPDAETQLARRKAVIPVRAITERAELAPQLPESITEARAARQAEREFSFESAPPVEVVRHPEPPADDGEFNFFARGAD